MSGNSDDRRLTGSLHSATGQSWSCIRLKICIIMCVSPCDWLYVCVWLSVCLCASAIRRGGEWSKDISAGGRAFRIIFSVNKGEMKNITLLLCQCFLFHMSTSRPIATWPHRSYKSQQGRRGRLQSWMASVENREIQREVNNCLVLSVRCGVSRPGEMTIRSGVCGLAWQRLHVLRLCAWENTAKHIL